MTGPGTPRDAALIRHARPADLDAVEVLENAVFPGDRLSRRSLRRSIGASAATFLVLERDGAIVGDAIVAFRRGSAVARLYSLAVSTAVAGQGFGTALLLACEEASRARGATRLRLEVRADNAAAIGLYTRAGYTAFGRYDDYYEDGEDAVRFEKPLTVPVPPRA